MPEHHQDHVGITLTPSRGLGRNSCARKPVNLAESLEAVRRIGLYRLPLTETPTARPAP